MNTVKVLMCGSELSVKGGMVSVIKNYLGYENWKEFQITYVPTHTEKNKLFVAAYFLLAYLRLLLLALLGRYQIIYLHTAERGSFYRKSLLVRTMKMLRIRTVMHHHAAEFEEFYAAASPKRKAYINKTLEMADLNIVLSKRLIPMIKEKAPRANVQVLYNAVEVPDQNPYSGKGRNILFLGRLGHRKGTYDLLTAMEDLKKDLPEDVQFYLCGDGEVDQVKEEVRKRGLERRVAHIGWIDGEKKKAYMKESMLNVLPSYNEGLPMTILETMAMGIPNISTNIASIPEVIEEGQNGYMIRPGDVETLKQDILLLAENEEKRCRISEQAWETVKNSFSLDANIAVLKRCLHQLLEK